MSRINIGIINNGNMIVPHTALEIVKIVRGCGCEPIIYSDFAIELASAVNVVVGSHCGDICLNDSTLFVDTEYIISMSDIIIVDNDSVYYRKSALERSSLLVIADNVYYNGNIIDYNADYIEKYITAIAEVDTTPEIDNNSNPFWSAAHGKFFKRYKRGAAKIISAEKLAIDNPIPTDINIIMSGESGIVGIDINSASGTDKCGNDNTSESCNGDANNANEIKALLKYYDGQATKYNAIYRSSLYLRALFPLIATLCVALAVNIKNIGNFVSPLSMWSIISSGLFFMQAVFNYMIIALANYVVKRHVIERFTNARYMAECLRMLDIACPVGLPLPSSNRIVFTDMVGNVAKLNMLVTKLMREHSATSVMWNKAQLSSVAMQLEHLTTEQINYHIKSALSYELAERRINMWAKIFFIAGLCVVIGRGLYQSIAQFAVINGVNNGVKTADFITSIVNVLALSVPPITALFTGLSASLNLDNNHVRSRVMSVKLQGHVGSLQNMQGRDYSFSDVNLISQSLANLFSQETLDWHMATRQKKVNKM